MTMPTRIQRQRRKGWRLPEGAVCVTRPGKWGNPWVIGDDCPTCGPPHKLTTATLVVAAFDDYARAKLVVEPGWLAPLRGKDLACWCAIGFPCHGDVLLELANA